MPNHVHGIIVIDKNDVETHDDASLPKHNKFGPQSKNLGSIIRGFKIGEGGMGVVSKAGGHQTQARGRDKVSAEPN